MQNQIYIKSANFYNLALAQNKFNADLILIFVKYSDNLTSKHDNKSQSSNKLHRFISHMV